MSLMVMAPVRVPVAVGLKTTLMLQLAPAATELPQVPNPEGAKSPLMAMLPMDRAALPVFVKVTD